MAQILPDMDPTQLLNTSEEPVYTALRDQLSDDYVILHSYPWLRPWRGEALVEGEADFVILHPSRGLLVLEVKGGSAIRYDGFRWFRITKTGEYEFQDPFSQAQRNMHAILEIAEERSGGRICKRDFVYGYAVVFPHLDYEGTPPPGSDKSIIISRRNLSFMTQAIETAYSAWTDEPRFLPYDRFQMLMNDCLMPKFRIFKPIGPDISQTNDQLCILTDTQAQIFMSLCNENRVLVCGVAGSGKTLLALHRALAFAREGTKTLFVCFNKELAAWIRRQVQSDSTTDGYRNLLTVKHIHGLAAELAEEAGIKFCPANGGQPTKSFWTNEVPDLMEQAIYSLSLEGREVHYHAIVVDEAQDFSEVWWFAMTQSLMTESHGPLYAFMDPNQSLWDEVQWPPVEFGTEFELTLNCRNTRCIAAASASVMDLTAHTLPNSPKGRPLKMIRASSSRQQKGLVLNELRSLLVHESVLPNQIAILGPAAKQNGSLSDLKDIDGVPFTTIVEEWHNGKGILITTARTFKGLEADVVLLYDLGGFGNLFRREDLYVACSRAKVLLVAVVHGNQCREVIIEALVASESE